MFFDDFNDGQFGSGRCCGYPAWTVLSGTCWTATGGYLTKTSGGGWHGLKTPFARDDAVWEFDMKAGGDSVLFRFIDPAGNSINSNGYSIYIQTSYPSRTLLYKTSEQATLLTFTRNTDTSFHRYAVNKDSSGLMQVFYDGVSKGNATDTGYSGSQYLSFWLYDAGGAIDNIHVRKYASPEPAWG